MSLVKRRIAAIIFAGSAVTAFSQSDAPASPTVPVSVDNFTRAESDLMFGAIDKQNGFGKFEHRRDLAPVDKQIVVRVNRDTLYSTAVFDLDAGQCMRCRTPSS